jgi:hypothetical protein
MFPAAFGSEYVAEAWRTKTCPQRTVRDTVAQILRNDLIYVSSAEDPTPVIEVPATPVTETPSVITEEVVKPAKKKRRYYPKKK